jgi:hypothetical protein
VADFKDTVSLVAKNLFTLEVNTIIKANILGTKMPPPVHALLDIASEYDTRVCADEKELGIVPPAPPPPPQPGVPAGELLATDAQFNYLRERADVCIDKLKEPSSPVRGKELELRLLLLQRIQDNSDQIRSIFQGMARRGETLPSAKGLSRAATTEHTADLPLLPNELLTLRKIWEIGLEQILAQTVLQVDGDVTTRIHPDLLKAELAQVLSIHQQAVSNSVGIWKALAGMLGSFLENVLPFLRGK